MRASLLAAFAVLAAYPALPAETFTYPGLVAYMKDLERLSLIPDPEEKVRTFSSYDRASAYSPGNDAYANWGANNDGAGFIRRQEDGRRVLAEMTGPGTIWRINGATKSNGHMLIYLDGSPTPAVDLAWNDVFGRTQAPFTHPSLAYTAAGGMSNHYPIPYKTTCKVVVSDDWNSYFYFDYTTFPKGTVLPTFTRNLAPEDLEALSDLNKFFTDGLGNDPAGARQGQTVDSNGYSVAAGQTATVLDQAGEGAITGIRMRVKGLATKDEQWAALRELALGMHWDGEAAMSVWSPLGDFFGSACGLNPYKSLPLGVREDGWMYAYWYMPYASRARITLKNDGTKARDVEAVIVRAPLARPIAEYARFHAKWNRNMFQPTRKDRWPDYTVLKTAGKGRFLGFMLHLFKTDDRVDPASAPGEYWWGEGDEKFFVDGEKSPSWFGTGSEDYFAYAWATPDLFSKPFHAQVYNEGSIHWKGNRAMDRFQISTAIPFQTGFEGAIEKYYSEAYTRYGVLPRWYLAPGGNDPYGETSLAERTGYYEAPQARDTTRIEAEDLRVIARSGGSLTPQYMDWAGAGKWSRDQHLFWYKNNLGDVQQNSTATLALPVTRAGGYRILANMTQAFDYGSIRFSLDGQACGGTFDLYHDGPATSGETELCTRTLAAGTHELGLAITGKSADAKAFYAGIDYLKLVPLPSALPAPAPLAAPSLRGWRRSAGGLEFLVSPDAESVEIFDQRGGRIARLTARMGRAYWQQDSKEAGNVRILIRVRAGARQSTRALALVR